jgi:pimeloyl-ACP methyl ester carboxylesterase
MSDPDERNPAPGRLSGCLGRRSGRVLLMLLVLVMVLVIAAVVYQAVSVAVDARRYPPPGEMVDVGGYRLHVNVMGERHDGPTVILENGGGGFSPQWGWVQPAVAEFARVVSYDRAGTGWSEASPEPLDAVEASEALYTALQKSGVPGPYVVAGHSMGALMARTFAKLYPGEVVGLVLVDPRPVNWAEVFPDGGGEANPVVFRLLSVLNRLGIPRLVGVADSQAAGLPPAAYEQAVALSYSPHHIGGMFPDGMVGDSATGFVAAGEDLDGLPLVVLSAGQPDESFGQEVRPRFTATHEEIASLSREGEHRVVSGANHLTIVTEQEYAAEVVEAIHDVVVRPGNP